MNFVYYHYYCTELSFDILLQTLNYIKQSELYDNTESITINITGDINESHYVKIKEKICPNFKKVSLVKFRSLELQKYMNSFSDLEIKNNHRLGIGKNGMELDTLKYLYSDIINNHLQGNVLYLHGKGSVHSGYYAPKKMNRDQWRLEMTECVIQNWTKCIQILKNKPHAGANFHASKNAGSTPVSKRKLKYSGNFWWATTEHIKSLQCPIEYAKSNRFSQCKLKQSPYYSAEFWLCSNLTKRGKQS